MDDDNDLPEDDCYHEDAQLDILTGRAHCRDRAADHDLTDQRRV